MTPTRRESDAEQEDWTEARRPIRGDEQELTIGAGKYRLTARGATVIVVIGVVAVLAMLYMHIAEQQKATSQIVSHISAETAAASREISRALRLQTCVLSMTAEERVEWRRRADAPSALMGYCPGLLFAP